MRVIDAFINFLFQNSRKKGLQDERFDMEREKGEKKRRKKRMRHESESVNGHFYRF